MARWAAPAACLALAGALLCLPALSGGSRGLAASPAPSAGSPKAQTADTPPPPQPAPPPPPPPATPPPAKSPPSTPPPSKSSGTGSQGGTSKGGSTGGTTQQEPNFETPLPTPPPPPPECLTPDGVCDCLRAPGCAMADTTVCHDIQTCSANQEYLHSCCALRRDVQVVNCDSGRGKQCPILFAQVPFEIALPGPGGPAAGEGLTAASTTAPAQGGGTDGGGSSGSGSGGGSTTGGGILFPSASSPAGGSSNAGNAGSNAGDRIGSGQVQGSGGTGSTGGGTVSQSGSAAGLTTTTTTLLPTGCFEGNVTCATSVCQLGHMACGNLTAFRCAALNCGGTCVEQCVANPTDWGPLACPDLSSTDALSGSCNPCATANCAEGTWCKAYEAANATWFYSNPCAYTCEPQELK